MESFKNWGRPRNILVFVGSLATLMLLFMIDPDVAFIQNLAYGSTTVLVLSKMSLAFLVCAMLYFIRKGMHDYPESDIQKLLSKAMESPEGAGMALIGMAGWGLTYAVAILAAFQIF